MLESIFRPKTVKELEQEKELLEKDLAIIKKTLLYLTENKSLCIGILKFGVKGEEVKQLFENLLEIEHLLQEEERTVEIKAISILQEALKAIADEDVREELNSLLQMLQEQKAIWEELLTLDAELKQKKYAIKPALVPRIRQLIEKQMQLLTAHEAIINKIIGQISETEAKIKEMLKPVYGRAVSKERAGKMKDELVLSGTDQLVPCFIMTTKMSDLIDNFEATRKELISIFRAIGAVQVEKIVLFRIDESQDLNILADCPPPQPQKISGIIEQKLPGRTRIKIGPVYSL